MKKRLLVTAAVLFAAACYGAVYLLSGVGLPCVFRLITGLLCPGCGVTHMLVSLARLDLSGAFRANPVLFVSLPFLLHLIVRSWACFLLDRPLVLYRTEQYLLVCLLLALGIFFVVRNGFL